MLVEISGLPGSGKTALAHELARLTGGSVARTHSGGQALAWSLKYTLRHPLVMLGAFGRSLVILLRSPSYGIYVLKVLVVMSGNTMYASRVARGRLVFLDEGMEQYTLSEARKRTRVEAFVRRLKRVRMANMSLFLQASQSERLDRLARRAHGVPRHELEADADVFINAQEKNAEALMRALVQTRGAHAICIEGKSTLQDTSRAFLAQYEKDIRGKLAIVLPEYHHDTATHFAHTYELFSEAAKHMSVVWGIERGELPPDGGTMIGGLLAGRHGAPFVRIWRTSKWMRHTKKSGVDTLYVHYSFVAAFVGSFIFDRVYVWNCGEAWKYPRNWFFEHAIRHVFRRVNVVTGTQGLAESYAKIYRIPRQQIHVLPNSISLERFQMGDVVSARAQFQIPEGSRVVTFIHHLSERKGAHYLPAIIKELANEQRLIFCIAGEGPHQEKLVRELSALPNVRLLGALPNRDIPKLLSITNVLIMPSNEEGFPRVLLEAMAMGVPFVASNVGGVKDIIPPSMQSHVVTAGDTKTFSNEVRSLLNTSSPELSQELRMWVTRYDLPIVTNLFLRLIAGG